jgi:hypothetical protein
MKKIIIKTAFLSLCGIFSASLILAATTTKAQNQTATAAVNWCYNFNTNLKITDTGKEVAALKIALQKEGFISNGTDRFDGQLVLSVAAFQEKYKSEILTPFGLKNGTGYVGPATRGKLNKLYSCPAANATSSIMFASSTASSGCIDSDGGINFDAKGAVWVKGSIYAGNYYDFCLNASNVLHEWACDGQKPKETSYVCPFGCEDGACKPPPCSFISDSICPPACSMASDTDCCTQSGKVWRNNSCIAASCNSLLSGMYKHYLTFCGDENYDFSYDINRDGVINALDTGLISSHLTDEQWCISAKASTTAFCFPNSFGIDNLKNRLANISDAISGLLNLIKNLINR